MHSCIQLQPDLLCSHLLRSSSGYGWLLLSNGQVIWRLLGDLKTFLLHTSMLIATKSILHQILHNFRHIDYFHQLFQTISLMCCLLYHRWWKWNSQGCPRLEWLSAGRCKSISGRECGKLYVAWKCYAVIRLTKQYCDWHSKMTFSHLGNGWSEIRAYKYK